MTTTITESGMTFGPHPEGNCFHIEQSQTYIRLKEGLKMAEFLFLKDNQEKGGIVWIIEAKSSSPRRETEPNFQKYINEICVKLTNAFLLFVAISLKRHDGTKEELPDNFRKLNIQTLNFRFVLVINGHEEHWLPELQTALSMAMKPLCKTWKLPPTSVAVLNDKGAQKYGLIIKA